MKENEGNAIVYCEGAYNTLNGKTAHGLVRFTNRYKILSVVDSGCAGQDAGALLDGQNKGIPVVDSIATALQLAKAQRKPVRYLVVGLAPDGGRLPQEARKDIQFALQNGLSVDCGLHDFLSDDPSLVKLAQEKGLTIRDIRKPPPREQLHFFSGKISSVKSLVIAILGTDSALGKRTTAWVLVHALRQAGFTAEMIGTGQTAWLQGARYSLVLDSLVNDFVSGEIEHAVYEAWVNEQPDVIIVEGQGSLMNPAYPGGFEILAAARPRFVILQHAPTRRDYDGFPGYPIHSLPKQIQAIELISPARVIAIAVNHEGMTPEEIVPSCTGIETETGLPAFDVLTQGPQGLLELIKPMISK